jgi:hypothetical protein
VGATGTAHAAGAIFGTAELVAGAAAMAADGTVANPVHVPIDMTEPVFVIPRRRLHAHGRLVAARALVDGRGRVHDPDLFLFGLEDESDLALVA